MIVSVAMCDWIMEPETFEGDSFPGWYAPTYDDPMYVYGPGFESDNAVGSGPMSWPDYWGNFIRTPIQDCSMADSVIMSFRMWNTGYSGDYARFYIWVEPDGYFGTTTYMMEDPRDWELINVDFTEWAAGESQVYFYLEANFPSNTSFTHEVKFDNIGIATNTVLSVREENNILPSEFELCVYPNPFNSVCEIEFEVSKQCDAEIEIYDIQGKNVGVQDFESLQAGKYRMQWDAGNLPSGIYFIRLSVEGIAISKRIVMVR